MWYQYGVHQYLCNEPRTMHFFLGDFFRIFPDFIGFFWIFEIFGYFGFFWIFLDFFWIFWIFWDFIDFFFWFFWFFWKLLRLLLKITEVTTKHQKWPKVSQNSIISSFFAQREKNSSAEGRSPPQELEVGPRSGPYLLVSLKN